MSLRRSASLSDAFTGGNRGAVPPIRPAPGWLPVFIVHSSASGSTGDPWVEGVVTMRRYPALPLARHAGCAYFVQIERLWVIDHIRLSAALGMKKATMNRAIDRGLPEYMADEWACRLGISPASVWPNWCDGIEWNDAGLDRCLAGIKRELVA
jgi:hypothetical protein